VYVPAVGVASQKSIYKFGAALFKSQIETVSKRAVPPDVLSKFVKVITPPILSFVAYAVALVVGEKDTFEVNPPTFPEVNAVTVPIVESVAVITLWVPPVDAPTPVVTVVAPI
jgi:hypothetical protein